HRIILSATRLRAELRLFWHGWFWAAAGLARCSPRRRENSSRNLVRRCLYSLKRQTTAVGHFRSARTSFALTRNKNSARRFNPALFVTSQPSPKWLYFCA